MRHILEFESAEEAQAALTVLAGKAETTKPDFHIVNQLGQSVVLVAKPGEAGGIDIELHHRGTVKTTDDDRQPIGGTHQLGPGERFQLG